MSTSSTRPGPRIRRTAEEARSAILEAAEKRLREGGPEAIRLQEIAGDLGISHPTILHHFGSREGLTRALSQRTIERLQEDLVSALTVPAGEGVDALAVVERALETLSDAGHARLHAWRSLGQGDPDEDAPIVEHVKSLTDLVHARRCAVAEAAGTAAPAREDSEFVVRLVSVSMLGDGVFGALFDGSGSGDPGDAALRFRAWLARVLVEHMRL